MKNNLTRVFNTTLNNQNLQLKMNFNTEIYVKDDGKVHLVENLIEEMNLNRLKATYSKKGRRPAVNPVTMLKVLLFCYSEGSFSCRDIEKMCRYDLRVIYLLDGQPAPDYSTINRFRKRLQPLSENILEQFINILLEDKHIDLSSIYIDGTKIEANANKYTFVWRKSVERYQKNLKEKIMKEFNMDENSNLEDVTKLLKYQFNSIRNICRKKKIKFVFGRGRAKTEEQRKYELYEGWIKKLKEYARHLEIMDERNSYSKTDHDATFMRMKDDHMRNGQLKPGYNIQFATTGQFIVGAYGSHHPNDVYTLIPFVESLSSKYEDKLLKIVADSGYESIENYAYLAKKNLKPFIKPSNYERKKKRKYKKEIGRRENMIYHEEDDYYECKNQKKLLRQKDKLHRRKTGYVQTLRVYRCDECRDCPYNKECVKYSKKENPESKTVKYSKEFEEYRKVSEDNITSKEGIDERINRSIQAEGVFSKLKDGLGYTRFRHIGLKNILSEINLMAVAININTLHNKLVKNNTEIIRYKKAS